MCWIGLDALELEGINGHPLAKINAVSIPKSYQRKICGGSS